MKSIIIASLLLGSAAFASHSPRQQGDVTEVTLDHSTKVSCVAGLDNVPYPTSSTLTISGVPALKGVTVYSPDARPEAIGDHCAELIAEAHALLPATVQVVHTQNINHGWYDGACVKTAWEYTYFQLGKFHFLNATHHVLTTVEDSFCQQ